MVAFIAYKIVDLLVGLRVTEEEEREGLDISSPRRDRLQPLIEARGRGGTPRAATQASLLWMLGPLRRAFFLSRLRGLFLRGERARLIRGREGQRRAIFGVRELDVLGAGQRLHFMPLDGAVGELVLEGAFAFGAVLTGVLQVLAGCAQARAR